MPLESGLIGYAAWASLALASKRGLPKPPAPFMRTPRMAMVAGYALMALSFLAAVLRFGPPIGVVTWFGQLAIAGALLILVLSWRPSLAFRLAAPALMGAALVIMVGRT